MQVRNVSDHFYDLIWYKEVILSSRTILLLLYEYFIQPIERIKGCCWFSQPHCLLNLSVSLIFFFLSCLWAEDRKRKQWHIQYALEHSMWRRRERALGLMCVGKQQIRTNPRGMRVMSGAQVFTDFRQTLQLSTEQVVNVLMNHRNLKWQTGMLHLKHVLYFNLLLVFSVKFQLGRKGFFGKLRKWLT